MKTIRGFFLVLLSVSSGGMTPSHAQWVRTNGPEGGTVRSLAARTSGAGGTSLFAGTDGGVFLSTNYGAGWAAVDSGLANASIYSLSASGTNLFAGTGGAGVWRRPLSELTTGISGHDRLAPLLYALEQNYPNPFNPTTVITGQWPATGPVRLVVYDILGREVATLADGRYPAGKFSFAFDAHGLASGTYFYRLEAGGFVQTRKCLILK